jgi:leucyl aminopeptidase (aminopeptidase T)
VPTDATEPAARSEPTLDPELLAIAEHCLRALLPIEPGQRVLVVTDAERRAIAGIWAAAAARRTGDVSTLIAPPRERHGQEPSPVVAAAMLAADVILQPVTHALTHTQATRDALAAGARVVVLRGITEAMMRRPFMRVDYHELRLVTSAVADALGDADAVHVTTPAGTDLRFSTTGRAAVALAGGIEPGRFGGPRTGEAAVAPLEGTAAGIIVLEHLVDDVGRLEAPVTLRVANGRVVAIDGGREAETLRRLVAAAGDGADNLAEFAVGTNPAAELSGDVPEAKKVRGSAHVALGDNRSLGGAVQSDLHVDGMLLRPTVLVDGRAVVVDGALQSSVLQSDDPGS